MIMILNVLMMGHFLSFSASPAVPPGPPETRRWCGLSVRHGLFFVLVVGTLFGTFFFNADVSNVSSDWSPRWLKNYDPKKWLKPFRRPEPSAVRTTNQHGSPTPEVLNATTPGNQSEPQTPPPYKSPGPYLVEYPSQYHFTINEPIRCEQQKPFLVLIVPVAPQNRAHRNIIRSTWGSESLVLDRVVNLFFLLGKRNQEGSDQLQEQLLQESKEHRDLIQSDFIDCYKNLTIKTMVMLEWLDSFCSGTPYAMKIDSDMFLNVPKLVGMLSTAPRTNYLTGLVARGGAVLRNKGSKWYVPTDLYPQAYYPRYALGLGYVLSVDLAKKLVDASRHVKALYIEDVYLGLCMQHLQIPPTDPPSWSYFQVFPVRYSRCAFSKLIATTTSPSLDRVWAWKDFKRPGPYC